MKLVAWIAVSAVTGFLFVNTSPAQETGQKSSGEKLFSIQCAACHPGGGNIVNPKKTLNKKDLAASNIKSEADIVKIIRNGAPGMMKFDTSTIPDKDAQEIASYILKSFK
jgi:cytochrome c6